MRQKARAILVTSVIVGVLASVTPAQQQSGGAVLYEGARLIIGDASAPIEAGAFVVQDGRITAIGPVGAVTAPANARRVDLKGKTVMPTLINAHAHIGFERFINPDGDYENPGYYLQYTPGNLVDHLQRYAYYGVGAIHDAGQDTVWVALQVQAAQRAGKLPPTARFFFAAGMAPPDGGMDPYIIRGTQPRRAVTEVHRPLEARAAVQDLASRGVRSIKLWFGARDGSYPAMPPEVYEAIIDEAHKHGMEVHGHAIGLREQKDAVRAGIDVLAHALPASVQIDAELAALVREKKPYWTDMGSIGPSPICQGDPFALETHAKEFADRVAKARWCAGQPNAKGEATIKANFQTMVKEGARVMLGTDSGVVPSIGFGWYDHHQLWSFVQWGLTPSEAIIAATSRPAQLLELKDAGTLATGKVADFIVLNANPLDDIKNTRMIDSVYLGGVAVDRAGLRPKWQRGDKVAEIELKN